MKMTGQEFCLKRAFAQGQGPEIVIDLFKCNNFLLDFKKRGKIKAKVLIFDHCQRSYVWGVCSRYICTVSKVTSDGSHEKHLHKELPAK